jgi:iron complex outermembrane recepter protein
MRFSITPSFRLLVAKYVLFTGLAVLLSHACFAQSAKITGSVTGKDSKPLSLVTVLLLRAADSSMVKTELTGNDGAFEIQAPAGSFVLHCVSMGYTDAWSSPFSLSDGQVYAADGLKMQGGDVQLKDATVVARKPLIEVKAGKTIFNVENSINATGSNALELLRKSPGMQVDNNDNITMRGKNGVKIYIDGKPSQLDVASLAAYLKGINSNDIEAIEIISNPSAKYDASGNAGIVNIKLKKNKKIGTNGSVSAGVVEGIRLKENGSLGLNYRDKKVNIFGNLSGNGGKYQNDQNLYRTSNNTIFDPHTVQISDNRNVNLKAGADFFLDKRNTIGFIVTSSASEGTWTSTGNTKMSDQITNKYLKTLDAYNSIPSASTNSDFNFNYRFADTSGREYNVDADYGRFVSRHTSYQPNYYHNNDNTTDTFIYRNYTPVNIDIYSLKADGEQNMWKGKLGYGLKFSYVKTANTLSFYNVINNVDILARGLSNQFAYTENVNAAYISYQKEFNERWSLQAGFRAEQTNSRGMLTRADSTKGANDDVKRSYTDLFPSGAITWSINKNNVLNLTYSRRIDRPTYEDLNPFEFKLDELTYSKGNAFLRPQYTHNVELTHTLLSTVSTTIGYSRVLDYAVKVLDTTSKNATYVQEQNIATQEIYSCSIHSSLPIRKWWNGYVSVWGNYQSYSGSITGRALTIQIHTYGGYLQQSFSLGHEYTAEVSGWYSGPGIWGATGKTAPQGSVDVGFQKKLLDKRLSLKLSVTDIFATASPWHIRSDFSGLVINGNGTWESRTLRLNATYQFGSAQIKSARQRETGLEQERKRLKG